jgi:hypothetical protein
MRNGKINLELFGMPRVAAGKNRIETRGADLRAVLREAVSKAPDLGSCVLDSDGAWLNPGYTFVVDGHFTNDPTHVVSPDSDVLLVARASGG